MDADLPSFDLIILYMAQKQYASVETMLEF
jgi:hypothetical protein